MRVLIWSLIFIVDVILVFLSLTLFSDLFPGVLETLILDSGLNLNFINFYSLSLIGGWFIYSIQFLIFDQSR